jgi:hypothetical protein
MQFTTQHLRLLMGNVLVKKLVRPRSRRGSGGNAQAIPPRSQSLTSCFITSKGNSIVMRLGGINQYVIRFLILFRIYPRLGARVDAGVIFEFDFVPSERLSAEQSSLKSFVIDFSCVLDAAGKMSPAAFMQRST